MGILAVHDYRARLLVDECHRKGLNVPNDVAIIGVDNDNLVCEFCSPPLSSVSRSGYRTGYETAVLLDRLMAGEPPPEEDVLIAPDGVIKRESTGLIVVDHPHVAAAVAYIRDHLNEPFGVERLIRVLPIGRRQLEYLFKKHLKRTPHDYLRRARIDRAKSLLSGPQKLGVAEIARQCGFADTHGFLMAFRHVEGKTPTTYRKEVSYR
jgi:LacI family transcriptional regulator